MSSTKHRHVIEFWAMGSPCRCEVVSQQADVNLSFLKDEVARLEQKYSRFIDNSLTSELAEAAQYGGRVTVDDETAGLFDLASQAYEMSDGLFDITSSALSKVWDFKQKRIPSAEQIEAALANVGWHYVVWQKPYVSFEKAVSIDFGGIVKEYAVDCLITKCREHGFDAALINLGGDVACYGAPIDKDAWQIGIQSPVSQHPLYTFEMRQGAIASSGDYARMFEIDGKRYSHIINPKTGWPVEDLKAVSVISELCVLAGIISTSAMLLGKTKALKWLDDLGLRYVLVDSFDKVYR